MLWGTFTNPEQQELEVGFYDGASHRLGHMLLAFDVIQLPSSPELAPKPELARR
jgi:hypothetical protein